MDRNWLIRTSQNQILGPVAKQKLLEFIQKGALGLTDEVTSGNGYWFALKEKDLVDKYLYGDIPQSYNPISESKSVLSKRENPEKTTSINSAPANKIQPAKDKAAGIVPKEEDLELPDITTVQNLVDLKLTTPSDDSKLPDSNDLEFPDVDKISSSVNESFKAENIKEAPVEVSSQTPFTFKKEHPEYEPPKGSVPNPSNEEKVLFPASDDLAFPDLNDYTSPKVDKGKVDLSHNYTRTVALDVDQASEALPETTHKSRTPVDLEGDYAESTLALHSHSQAKVEEADTNIPPAKRPKAPVEDRKLLHDRKPKSNMNVTAATNKAALRDPTRENYPKEAAAGTLKKRNDNYIFFILIILALIVLAIFFYFKEILNKPLPV